MKKPQYLYRFRPLSAAHEYEFDALERSYLFAPSFAKMNDPMEAFYEFGGPGDNLVDAILAPQGSTAAMYSMARQMVDNFGLISFTQTKDFLPLWAYYANNFSGMCLEFETSELECGDLRGEPLVRVDYKRQALPPVRIDQILNQDVMVQRISRKRIEWAHEKEWRYLAGQPGPRHYLDDALKRVYLGPLVAHDHEVRICEILKRRPVEVLKGKIHGFEMEFVRIQQACPLKECDRTGAGTFVPEDAFGGSGATEFFGDRYGDLIAACAEVAGRLNTEEIQYGGVSSEDKRTFYVHSTHQLRSGRLAYHTRYFDRRVKLVPDPSTR